MLGSRVCLWASVIWALALPATAQVRELDLSADQCAIAFALTGTVSPGCPTPVPQSQTRSGKATTFPKDAAPLGSDSLNKGYYIRFAFNSENLTQEYQDHLGRLGQVLTSPNLADLCIRLVGHTDSVGSQTFNLALSAKRAKSVQAFLTKSAGIPSARVSAVGVGKVAPLPGYEALHPLQRRVEILARDPENGRCGQ